MRDVVWLRCRVRFGDRDRGHEPGHRRRREIARLGPWVSCILAVRLGRSGLSQGQLLASGVCSMSIGASAMKVELPGETKPFPDIQKRQSFPSTPKPVPFFYITAPCL